MWHSHDGLAPHSHEPIYSPGDFTKHAPPLASRAFTDRLHRWNWRPRRHGVSSIVSYYFPLLFPTAGSLDHIVQCGYLEAVVKRNASPLHSCRGCFVIPNSSSAPLRISVSSGILVCLVWRSLESRHLWELGSPVDKAFDVVHLYLMEMHSSIFYDSN